MHHRETGKSPCVLRITRCLMAVFLFILHIPVHAMSGSGPAGIYQKAINRGQLNPQRYRAADAFGLVRFGDYGHLTAPGQPIAAWEAFAAGDATLPDTVGWGDVMITDGMATGLSFAQELELINAYGNATPTRTFPAVGALLISESNDKTKAMVKCSGTLVTTDKFLTARHCWIDNSYHPGETYFYWVYLAHSRIHEVVDFDRFMCAEVTEVPCSEADQAAGDIAIANLKTPAAGIVPVPLAQSRPADGVSAQIVGFGITHSDGADTGVKRRADVRPLTCDAAAGPERALCFSYGDSTKPRAHCSHDSGGPMLVVETPNPLLTWILLPTTDKVGQYSVDPDYRLAATAKEAGLWCDNDGKYVNLAHPPYHAWLQAQIGTEKDATPVREEIMNRWERLDDWGDAYIETRNVSGKTGVRTNLSYSRNKYGATGLNDFDLKAPPGSSCEHVHNAIETCEVAAGTQLQYEVESNSGAGDFQVVITADGQ